MLRFILIVMLLVVITKVSQDNPYIGFGIYFALYVGFMIYTLNIVDKSESNLRISKQKIKSNYDAYFSKINTK